MSINVLHTENMTTFRNKNTFIAGLCLVWVTGVAYQQGLSYNVANAQRVNRTLLWLFHQLLRSNLTLIHTLLF